MKGEVSSTSRRRFARRQWSRRFGHVRLVAVLTTLLAVVGLCAWVVGFSGLLDVRGVRISGIGPRSGLTEAAVEDAADAPYGDPLARADLDAVRARVAGLPAVRAVEVTRAWPHDLAIDITERTPAAVWATGSSLRVVDPDGTAFRTVDRAPSGLSTIAVRSESSGGAGPPTEGETRSMLAAGARVARSLPKSVSRRVELIIVGSLDSVSLRLSGDVTVMWGSAEQSKRKAEVLQALLREKRKVYDVSVPGFPTVKG